MSVARFRQRNRIAILSMHGVMNVRPGQLWKPFRSYLPPASLEQYLKQLARCYRFISLRDAVDMLAGLRPIERNCLVITFDDGYRNHATEAWPILRQHSIPATFFVATSFVENPRPFWFDRLDFAFHHLPDRLGDVVLEMDGRQLELSVADRHQRRDSFYELLRKCKEHGQAVVESVVGQVEDVATRRLSNVGEGDEWTALMSRQEVCELAKEGADIGSHTVDHILLDKATDNVATEQLVRSKVAIEGWTGRECAHLCYPSGRFSHSTVDLAKQAGYSCGLTTIDGANRLGCNPFMLCRIHVPLEGSDTEILARMTGVSQALHSLKTRLLQHFGATPATGS